MAALTEQPEFDNFSFIELDETGRILMRNPARPTETQSIQSDSPEFEKAFDQLVVLPEGCTDLFIWVHGWRNKESHAMSNARTLFPAIQRVYQSQQAKNPSVYPSIEKFNPAFLAIHWPSNSWVWDYDKIRDRAKSMTEEGEAEYVLAKLLGYLEKKNPSRPDSKERKTLAAAGGFYVHCLGHSFGGRVLTAAIQAAATPSPITKTLSLREPIPPFFVDSMLIFQMAAPAAGFAKEFNQLVDPNTPLRLPCVLTHSVHDTANRVWHVALEKEEAVGARGAVEPKDKISDITLHDLATPYTTTDFSTPLVNVDAQHLFDAKGPGAGAHGDYWYEESVHLALSLAENARR